MIFSAFASKPMTMICQWFDIKTTVTVFSGLTSKPVATIFSGLTQNQWRRFSPENLYFIPVRYIFLLG
jgi:hypothetical protein